MLNVKIGHSHVSIETLVSYLGAIQVSNSRAAMYVERRQIVEQLASAAMPAQILGNMRLIELAALQPRVSIEILHAIAQRLAHIERAEKALT